IMEYLVNISIKARILELKRRNMKITDPDIQYAVSIKEDTAYPCLHFTKYHKELKSYTPYPYSPIRRTSISQYNVPEELNTLYPRSLIHRTGGAQYAVSRKSDTPYPNQLKKILEYFIRGAHAKQPQYAVLSSNTLYRPIFRVYKYQTLNMIGYAFNHQVRFPEDKRSQEGPTKCSNH
ncbi:hypothetical protein Tco_1387401, partial [Tanacetum coccineum]